MARGESEALHVGTSQADERESGQRMGRSGSKKRSGLEKMEAGIAGQGGMKIPVGLRSLLLARPREPFLRRGPRTG